MRIAYFDCFSGISGDMALGALLDAGVPVDLIERGVQSMGLGNLRFNVSTVKKHGFRATHVVIEHPPEHAHRHLHHIEAMIDQATEVVTEAKDLAKQIFRNLGEAEATVHGTTLQKVHFHEVGAIDSIADIVGVSIGLNWLGLDAVEASPIPTGGGMIEIAHGRVSVPAPATALLLKGIPLASSDQPFELTTPTGAAILKTVARRFGTLPSISIEKIGYGAGTRDLPGQANVLRLMIGEITEPSCGFPMEVDEVVELRCNVDSMTPEEIATCVSRLWDAGAIDVFQKPCLMKKGRSGVEITVLAAPSRYIDLEEVLFEHSGTIGVRRSRAERHKLIRRFHRVETEIGPLEGKCVWLPSGRWRFSVEHDSVVTASKLHGLSLEQVRTIAARAFESAPPVPPSQASRSVQA